MENAISVQFTKYVNQRIKLKHFDGENCKTEADVHGAASTCFFPMVPKHPRSQRI